MPDTSAVPVVSRNELLEFMRLHGDLSGSVSAEILRDLTYSPETVPWTDVQYQPVIPVVGDRFALPTTVISGSNFERNLLAIVDRLPWRKDAASRLKQLREGAMIDRIRDAAPGTGLRMRERLELRGGKQTIGDVDLLVWDAGGLVGVAVELKWFFGPDSVHETWTHAESYRLGADKHLKTVEFLKSNLPRIISDHRLEGLTPAAEILPMMVTKDDEPLRRAIPLHLPVVTLRDFEALLRSSGGDLRCLVQKAEARWNREPTMVWRDAHRRLTFGSYQFDVPTLHFESPDPSKDES